MMAYSHVVTGLVSWNLTAIALDMPVEPYTVGAAVLGALLPDIDHPKSWLGRRLYPISAVLSAVIGHRGVTHSLIAVIALAVALIFAYDAHHGIVMALCVGYLTHLAGDFVTNSGIPLFWPIKRRFALPLASTGGFAESLLVAVYAAGSVWMFGLAPILLPTPAF